MNLRTTTRWILVGALGALSLVGCNRAEHSASAAQSASAGFEGRMGGRFARDPAQMVQRFDQNGNGALEVSELPERMQAHLGAADTNHDGALSTDELTAFQQTERAARFAELDADHDGAVTESEAGARWAFLSRADADHDGRVTQAEFAQPRPMGGEHGFRGMGGMGGMRGGRGMGGGRFGHADPARMIQRFDVNGDGVLQVSELPPRMATRLGNADADHDGALSASELSAAMPQRAADQGPQGEESE